MRRSASDQSSMTARPVPASVIADAEQLLAGTADSMNPDTPAPVLLACLAQYRAYLAALVAASRRQPHSDGQCFFLPSSDSGQDHI